MATEPVTTQMKASDIPVSSTIAAASSAATGGDNANTSLRDALMNMQPAKPDGQTAAQSVSTQPPAEPKKDDAPPADGDLKRGTAPLGTDVSEHKRVEHPGDEPAEAGSALEGFRTGLRKQVNAKAKAAEPKGDAAAPADTSAAPADDDAPVTGEEIEKTINDPAISKRHQKRMIFLATRAKELEAKLKEAEAKPSTPANDARVTELEKQIAESGKELVQFRRRYSLESEPELKKFDETAARADEAITAKLKEVGLQDATLNIIKELGGFEAFSRSTRAFTVNVKGEDGETKPTQVTAAQLAHSWLKDMPVADAEYIRTKLGERISAVDGKKRRTEELTAGAEEWFKQRQQEAQSAAETFQKNQQANVESYRKWATDWAAKQDWLKDLTVPADATAEEKAEIEGHNRHNGAIRTLLEAASNIKSVDDYTALVGEAAHSAHLRRQVAKLEKELKAANTKLEGVRKGVTTTGKPGAASIAVTTQKKEPTAADQLATTASDGLRQALEDLRAQQTQ